MPIYAHCFARIETIRCNTIRFIGADLRNGVTDLNRMVVERFINAAIRITMILIQHVISNRFTGHIVNLVGVPLALTAIASSMVNVKTAIRTFFISFSLLFIDLGYVQRAFFCDKMLWVLAKRSSLRR